MSQALGVSKSNLLFLEFPCIGTQTGSWCFVRDNGNLSRNLVGETLSLSRHPKTWTFVSLSILLSSTPTLHSTILERSEKQYRLFTRIHKYTVDFTHPPLLLPDLRDPNQPEGKEKDYTVTVRHLSFFIHEIFLTKKNQSDVIFVICYQVT